MDLLRAYEVNVRIDATRCDDLALACDDVRAAPHDHPRRDVCHDIRVARLADTDYDAVLDTNVGLVDATPVNNQRVRHHQIQGPRVGPPRRLAHALPERLSAAELALVPVHGQISLDAHPQVRHAQAHAVSRRGAKHGGVGGTVHAAGLDDQAGVSGWLGLVCEAGGLQVGDDLLGAAAADDTRGEVVAALDDPVASDVDKGDRLGVARLEAHRGTGGDVEAHAIGCDAVKGQGGVGLDKVVVAADLDGAIAAARDAQAQAVAVLVELDGRGGLQGHDGAGGGFRVVGLGGVHGEETLGGDGHVAPVEGAVEVAIVGGDGVVDGDEIGAGGESALYLNLV